MKKIIAIILTVAVMVCVLACGCAAWNKQFFDTTYKFDRAIIALPDGSVMD